MMETTIALPLICHFSCNVVLILICGIDCGWSWRKFNGPPFSLLYHSGQQSTSQEPMWESLSVNTYVEIRDSGVLGEGVEAPHHFPIPCPMHLFPLAVSQLYPFIINQQSSKEKKKEWTWANSSQLCSGAWEMTTIWSMHPLKSGRHNNSSPEVPLESVNPTLWQKGVCRHD